MPDIINLIKKWWKQMLTVAVISSLIVGAVTFIKPLQYLSIATAVPSSSISADRSKIFNENIQGLYSALGTTDDLDLILGTAKLDTIYLAVSDQFNLFDHYKISEKGNEARVKAALLLKKNTSVVKSEYGELKVKLWDTDKNLAPQLANAIMDQLQLIHQNLQSTGNEAALKGLTAGKNKLQLQLDSINQLSNKTTVLKEQLMQYEKLIGEYQLMVDSKPPAIVVVENAKPATRPDRPRRLQISIATAVLSLFFSLLAILVLERRKN